MPAPPLYRCELLPGHAGAALQYTYIALASRFALGKKSIRHPSLPLSPPFALHRGVTVRELRQAVESAAGGNCYFSYLLTGFLHILSTEGAAVAYRVRPSPPLTAFREELARFLMESAYVEARKADQPQEPDWSIPIASGLSGREYEGILTYLSIKEPPPPLPAMRRFEVFLGRTNPSSWRRRRTTPLVFPLDAFRIGLIRQDRVVSEFDMIRHRWDLRPGNGNRRDRTQSLRPFRVSRGYELPRPLERPHPEVWISSDLHIGHSRVIRSSARPFHPSSTQVMDDVLVRNWNRTVMPGDSVYFLGDLCGRREQVAGRAPGWLNTLNGIKHFVAGNHDTLAGFPEGILQSRLEMTAGGVQFEMIHSPRNSTPGFPGWVIHGHVHNTHLDRYPFFDPVHRRVNVSVEVTGYQPVALSRIVHLIRTEKDCLLTLV